MREFLSATTMSRIGRGCFRLWVLISIAWLGAVALARDPAVPIAWPWSAPPMIHVKVSDKETWNYPALWGVERIKADVTKKLTDQYEDNKKFAASISAERRAYCVTLSDVPVEQRPKDCGLLSWFDFGLGPAVPYPGWEDQFQNLPIPISQAAPAIASVALGPPLLLLVIGRAFGWAISGFGARK